MAGKLWRQALASSRPDPEKIARLRLTLEEVQAANARLLRLVAEWSAEPYGLPSDWLDALPRRFCSWQ
jgi:hypothetical protein